MPTLDLPTIDMNYEFGALQNKKLKVPFWIEDQRNNRASESSIPLFYKPGFFAHYDPTNPELIRFRHPKEKGVFPFSLSKDFMSAKPGKFLKEFFGDILTEPQIAQAAAIYRADALPPELILAQTPDEIEQVYDTGPESCMRKPGQWGKDMNPVRAYAGHGLAIGYIKRRGKITARALCWPEKQIYSRIYGDAENLKRAFADKKYTNAFVSDMTPWYGARLGLIQLPTKAASGNDFQYNLPYGDGVKYVNLIRDSQGKPSHFEIVSQSQHVTPFHSLSGNNSTAGR